MAGNPQIKRANAQSEYTPTDIQDLKRCAIDPVYFIKTFVRVQHPTKGNVPFLLFDYQEELILAIHENREVLILSARQTGKCVSHSTLINTIKVPINPIKKFLLKMFDRKLYDKISEL